MKCTHIFCALVFSALAASSASAQSSKKSVVVPDYGKLAFSFEANEGQTDAHVRFLSRGHGYSLFLTGKEAVIALEKDAPPSKENALRERAWVEPQKQTAGRGTVLRMQLFGANAARRVEGREQLPGKANYFVGNDPSKWRTNVPTYAKVKYEGVYPGVDLVYYGNQGQLEYDFVVAPGADPNKIQLKMRGAGKLRVDGNGDLLLGAAGDAVRFRKPVVYQEVSGERKPVEGNYVQVSASRIAFRVGEYDHSQPLVIDPVFSYSSYLGGSGYDIAMAVAVDAAGNAYVTGQTYSTNFPTANASQPTSLGSPDAFVTKINPSGSALVYSTYLGGASLDYGSGIAVDSAGDAYVTGTTASTNFPTANALQSTLAGGWNAFVTKLSASGSALVYSTYLGGTGTDNGSGIAVDSARNAYVTGETSSTNFPTAIALQSTLAGNLDAFVTKINPSGSALVYSTYLGGSGQDGSSGIAVDSAGNAYVAGYTYSTNFPTANPLQSTLAGGENAFVTKLNASGSALGYSTYLGGASYDSGSGIAVDSAGDAYVTGAAESTNFPTANALQSSLPGHRDAFVTKLSASGTALVYSTYLGGGGDDGGLAIAVDPAGNAYVTGWANSPDFPVISALQATPPSTAAAFVSELNASGAALVYSTYLGGSAQNTAEGIAVDSAGSAYVVGDTSSTDFPTVNALQTSFGGQTDGFITKISQLTGPAPSVVSLTPRSGTAVTQTFSVTVNDPGGSGDLNNIQLQLNATQTRLSSCSVSYDVFTNTMSLYNDSGTGFVGQVIPGSSTQVSNGQCTLSGTGSSYSTSGDMATLAVALTFSAPFSGRKNAYVYVQGDTGLNSGWQLEGLWTVDGLPPAVVSLTPNSGIAVTQIFTLVVNDPVGLADLNNIQLLVNATATRAGGCNVNYDVYSGSLSLYNDAGTGFSGGNSQCAVSAYGWGTSISGNTLTLTVGLTFSGSFGGQKNLYAYVQGTDGLNNGGWQLEGTWTPSGQAPPVIVSLSPSSGTGAAQIFTVVVSDPNGAADLNNIQLLINTAANRSSGCNVSYDVYSNTLSFNYTGPGYVNYVPPVLTPGSSAAVSTGLCTLSGAGSSYSTSGNTATLSLALTFIPPKPSDTLNPPPSFNGSQNVYAYVQGNDGLNNGGFELEGTWTPLPLGLSVWTFSPNSGAGTAQTFTVGVNDPSGAADVNNIQLLFNTMPSRLNGCDVSYDAYTNTLSLYNDGGSGFAGGVRPGSSAQVSNSQCILSGMGSSWDGVFNLNVALTFSASFSGQKNIYVYAQGNNGLNNGGWALEGTWLPAPALQPPTVGLLSPNSGTGTTQAFSMVVNDPNGPADLSNIQLLLNTTATRAGGCNVSYDGFTKAISLYNDAGTGFVGAVASGASGQVVSNSQCTLSGAGLSSGTSGNTATLNVVLTFSATFGGQKNAYGYVQGYDGPNNGGWQLEGTWTPSGQAPVILSLSPNSGGGATQTFSLVVNDPNGAGELNNIQLLLNATATRAGGCNVSYDVYSNTLSLYNDAGTGFVGGVTLGSSTQVSNGQCTLSATGSSYGRLGNNNATLTVVLTFLAAFTGQQNAYAYAQGNDGLNNGGWALDGTWTPSVRAPTVVSLSPNSGGGATQIFTLSVTDPAGPADLNNIQLLFNTTASRVSACAVNYDVITNTLYLYSDNGTALSGGVAPGSANQASNSQCTLSGAGSSYSTSVNSAALKVALTFSGTFAGQQNASAYVQGSDGLNNGWQLAGTWVP